MYHYDNVPRASWLCMLALLGCTKADSGATQPPVEPARPAEPIVQKAPPEPTGPSGVAAFRGIFEHFNAKAMRTAAPFEVALPAAAEKPQTPLVVLSELFGDNKVCTLPKNLKKKLKGQKDKTPKGVLPAFVAAGVAEVLNIEGPRFSSVEFAHIIHLFNFSASKPENTVVLNPRTSPKLDGSPTVRNLDIRSIQAPKTAAMFYELDCSGYLTASMKATANAGMAKVKTDAALGIESSASMVALRVIAASPVGLALDEGIYDSGVRLSPLDRFGVLFSLAQAAKDRPVDEYIVAPKYVHIVATATQQQRNLQGGLNTSASAGGTVGVASGAVSTESGFSISSGVSYSTFEVIYLPLPPDVLGGVAVQKVGDVRKAVQDLALQATAGVKLDAIGSKQVFQPVLPSTACKLEWKLGTAAGVNTSFGRVDPNENGGGRGVCAFTLTLNAEGITALNDGSVYVHYEGLGLKMHVPKQ